MTGERMSPTPAARLTADAHAVDNGLQAWIDGSRPLSSAVVAAIAAMCDRSEERGHVGAVTVRVCGAPDEPLTQDLTVALVNKWELALRRLERLPAVTVAVADGDCGGLALDALLATDYRIATTAVRLLMPVSASGATWPGMALYRLARQAGESATRRFALFGTPIEAGEALAMRLIDELTDDLPTSLAAALRAAASLPGRELAIRRQLMMDATTVSFEDALGAHLAACDRALRWATADAAR